MLFLFLLLVLLIIGEELDSAIVLLISVLKLFSFAVCFSAQKVLLQDLKVSLELLTSMNKNVAIPKCTKNLLTYKACSPS